MITLKELLDISEKGARKNIKNQPRGQLMPTFIGVPESGEVLIIGAPFNGDLEKQMVIATVRAKFRECNIKAYAMVSECWLSIRANMDEVRRGPRPGLDPDRQEAVAIVASDGFNSLARYLRMERDSIGNVIKLIKDPPEDVADSSGRFLNILSNEA